MTINKSTPPPDSSLLLSFGLLGASNMYPPHSSKVAEGWCLQFHLGQDHTPDADKRLKVAATFAVEQFNEASPNPNYFKELIIEKADVQLMGDTIISLKMQVGETVCEKSNQPMPYSEIQKCELPPLDQQETLVCNFELLKVRNKLYLINSQCF